MLKTKTLIKGTEDDSKTWKDILCSWIGRTNIIKMAVLCKAIYRFNATPVNTAATSVTEREQTALKLIWNRRRPQIAQQS